ncbi:hypothetical protein NA78x_001050 [Anatilimnocola sp. NA78]|uniref:hypothetical protein n=1 Tax=Anatilimnocola sp. NA78 TaxID=3415683 RepID=UPI003CE5768F
MPEQSLAELNRLADETLETMQAAVKKALENSPSPGVIEDMDTMHTAVAKAQQASLHRGIAICFEIDGVVHYKLPSGEITREYPWPEVAKPDQAE